MDHQIHSKKTLIMCVTISWAVILLGIAFSWLVCSESVDYKEIRAWRWGASALQGKCPVKRLPISISPSAKLLKITEAQVTLWNSYLSRPVFVLAPGGVPVTSAPKSHPQYSRRCAPVKLGDGGYKGQMWPHVFAWVDFRGSLQNWKIAIYVCTEKYRKAVKLVHTPVAKQVRQIGLGGLILHELGHLLIGPGHPRYADLMSKSQRLVRLHAHTHALIEETLIKPCKYRQ